MPNKEDISNLKKNRSQLSVVEVANDRARGLRLVKNGNIAENLHRLLEPFKEATGGVKGAGLYRSATCTLDHEPPELPHRCRD